MRPGCEETVILTYPFWREKFGGDPSAIGRRILLDGRPREIIGVLPERFRFLDWKPSFVLPIRLDRGKTRLGQFNYTAVARLKEGTSVAQASADVARMIPMALQRFPRSRVSPLKCSRTRTSLRSCDPSKPA